MIAVILSCLLPIWFYAALDVVWLLLLGKTLVRACYYTSLMPFIRPTAVLLPLLLSLTPPSGNTCSGKMRVHYDPQAANPDKGNREAGCHRRILLRPCCQLSLLTSCILMPRCQHYLGRGELRVNVQEKLREGSVAHLPAHHGTELSRSGIIVHA